MKKTEFDIRLQQKDLYQFNMYHSYHKVQTWLFTVLGIVIFALSFITINQIEVTYTLLYAVCGLLFVFYTPVNLRTTVKFRMKEGSPLTKKLHYCFSEKGINVSLAQQEMTENTEQAQSVGWSQIYRVVETKKQILIYTSRVNASVLPKGQITQIDELRSLLQQYLPSHRIKLKK